MLITQQMAGLLPVQRGSYGEIIGGREKVGLAIMRAGSGESYRLQMYS